MYITNILSQIASEQMFKTLTYFFTTEMTNGVKLFFNCSTYTKKAIVISFILLTTQI